MTLNEIKQEVIDEIHRAEKKFPWWPKDVVHAAAIVAEEAGELQKAALQFNYEGCEEDGDFGTFDSLKKGLLSSAGKEAVKHEAMQVIAMAYRLLFYIEDYWPGQTGRFEEEG